MPIEESEGAPAEPSAAAVVAGAALTSAEKKKKKAGGETADVSSSSSSSTSWADLRASVRKTERHIREAAVYEVSVGAQIAETRRMLNAFRRTKGKEETLRMSWFCMPAVQPSDYLVYVRRPMDLGTIQQRIEGRGEAYKTFGALFRCVHICVCLLEGVDGLQMGMGFFSILSCKDLLFCALFVVIIVDVDDA